MNKNHITQIFHKYDTFDCFIKNVTNGTWIIWGDIRIVDNLSALILFLTNNHEKSSNIYTSYVPYAC